MSTVCGRPQGEGVRPMWTHVDRGRGSKTRLFCGRHNGMTLGSRLPVSDKKARPSLLRGPTMGGDLGGWGTAPQNLRWGTVHASVLPIFGEVHVDLRDVREKY